MFARAAGADEPMLRPAIAFDFGVLKGRPIGTLVAEAADMGSHDLFQRHLLQFGRALMPRYGHGCSSFRIRYSAASADGRVFCISSHNLAGESGRSRGETPNCCSASATALAITPPTGMMPPSPAPLAPSGLIGEGSSSIRKTRIFGKSHAVAIR